MNAAGPSNQSDSRAETQTNPGDHSTGGGDKPPGQATSAAAVGVNPLIWAIQLWVIASVSSLILAAGVSQALRGAFVGMQRWIVRVDHSAALTSQVAAICTALLLVYMGMLSARASKSLLLGIGASLLGVAPTIVVFYAHRMTLPQAHGWISAICASGALVLSATQMRTNGFVRIIVAASGLSLFSAALRSGGIDGSGSPLTTELGNAFQALFSWATVALVCVHHLRAQKGRPLRGALVLGTAIVLASTVEASTQPGAPSWILVVGRSIGELSLMHVIGPSAPLSFCLALSLVFSAIFRDLVRFCSWCAPCSHWPRSHPPRRS